MVTFNREIPPSFDEETYFLKPDEKKESDFSEKILSPCVRCGSAGILRQDAGSYGYTPPTVWIACTNETCGIESPHMQTEDWDRKRGTFSIFQKALKYVIWWWEYRKEN